MGRKYIGFELDRKYADISQQKLKQIKPNYRIGENWVSFYLRDIATIRNNDWKNLEQYFTIPNPLRTIDYQRAELKNRFLIPRDFEFQVQEDVEEINIIVPKTSVAIPQREKVVAYVAAAANFNGYMQEV